MVWTWQLDLRWAWLSGELLITTPPCLEMGWGAVLPGFPLSPWSKSTRNLYCIISSGNGSMEGQQQDQWQGWNAAPEFQHAS
jgi:hypothetical protein